MGKTNLNAMGLETRKGDGQGRIIQPVQVSDYRLLGASGSFDHCTVCTSIYCFVFFKRVGIPMVTNCAPLPADLYWLSSFGLLPLIIQHGIFKPFLNDRQIYCTVPNFFQILLKVALNTITLTHFLAELLTLFRLSFWLNRSEWFERNQFVSGIIRHFLVYS